MTRRVAALFGLFAFAVAWLVGVWCGHSPLARLENAGIALVSGCVAGLGVGVALERIVLARLAEQWQEPGVAAPPAA
jgi:steroid 5-alpha reductase family enzyme